METTLEVSEASQVGEVRRVASEMARAQQMSEDEVGRVSLVATEVSTNLVKYGSRGSVLIRPYSQAPGTGVEMIAIDHGPGFDLAGAMRDGHSTGGSLGLGLGSIKRASSYFDVYTLAGQGTAVLARIDHGKPPRRGASPSPIVVAGHSMPKKGQIECGDAWRIRDLGNMQLICIVDGLGHGPLAAMAARRALAAFDAADAADEPGDIVLGLHTQLKDTRGVVVGVLALDCEKASAVYCGVGNINAVITDGSATQHLLSIDGIVGYNVRKVRSQEVQWLPGSVAILHTDGLSARWGLRNYPGLLSRHASLVAAVLFRDHARDADDATIVVAKGV
jgi:anti-sigma regulatory factor (Ser/Thr protein kinase)